MKHLNQIFLEKMNLTDILLLLSKFCDQSDNNNANHPNHLLPLKIEGFPTFFNDQHFISELIDEETRTLLRKEKLESLFQLSFYLRYRLTQLNLLSHLITQHDTKETSEIFCKFFSTEQIDSIGNAIDLIHQLYPQKGSASIFIGFAASGVFLEYLPQKRCRAFDGYDLHGCSEIRQGIFCKTHQSETWWKHDVDANSTGQARMFHFYKNLSNMHQYDEASLEAMTSEFWKKYLRYQNSHETKKIDSAIKTLHIKNCDKNQITLELVKKHYYQKALTAHPDQGGDQDEFVLLKDAYHTLIDYCVLHGDHQNQ